ncbi:MAG: 50S ribosomal protein L8e [Promethearchaeota archaeon CR_4]|nr:MAG: 50S ribosomal protein L8e [Candidatus Lokiarchaeota archaeon CR_4]
MGKHILVQRKGRAHKPFTILATRRRQAIKHRRLPDKKTLKGKIIDLVHESARGTPLAEILYEDGVRRFELPPEGIAVGDIIEIGDKVPLKVGNTMKLRNIEDGAIVYNIELHPGDGGRFVRGSGTFATIVSRAKGQVNISLPSGEMKSFDKDCRATIGVVSGGGRLMKPLMKAGNAFYLHRAKGRKHWPRVRSNMMNAVSHPFGGGYKAKRPKTTSRNAPPGRKVGLIAARRTGTRKK